MRPLHLAVIDRLLVARDVIVSRGWLQGRFCAQLDELAFLAEGEEREPLPRNAGAVCAEGALRVAVYGTPLPGSEAYEDDAAAKEVFFAKKLLLRANQEVAEKRLLARDRRWMFNDVRISVLNDCAWRTQDEVVEGFNRAIRLGVRLGREMEVVLA